MIQWHHHPVLGCPWVSGHVSVSSGRIHSVSDENFPGNSTKTEVWGSQLRVGPETFLQQCFYLSAILCNQSIFWGKEPHFFGDDMG